MPKLVNAVQILSKITAPSLSHHSPKKEPISSNIVPISDIVSEAIIWKLSKNSEITGASRCTHSAKFSEAISKALESIFPIFPPNVVKPLNNFVRLFSTVGRIRSIESPIRPYHSSKKTERLSYPLEILFVISSIKFIILTLSVSSQLATPPEIVSIDLPIIDKLPPTKLPIVPNADSATFSTPSKYFVAIGFKLLNIDVKFEPILLQLTLSIPFCIFSTKVLKPLFSYRLLNAFCILEANLLPTFAPASLILDVGTDADEPLLDALDLSGADKTFSLSNPATLLLAFSALFVTPSRACELSVAPSEMVDIDSVAPEPPLEKPKTCSVNALNFSATPDKLAIKLLITLITGVKTLIKPWPIVAFKLSKRSCKTLTWFAQLSEVRVKSPWAPASCCWTKAYLKETFSASVIAEVVFPKPFAKAKLSSDVWVITTPKSFRLSVSPVKTDLSFVYASSWDRL